VESALRQLSALRHPAGTRIVGAGTARAYDRRLFRYEESPLMPMETTLLIVKPDGVQRGLVGRILTRFEEKGLQLVGMKMMTIPRSLAETHYAAHKEKKFYPGLVRFMTSSPVVVFAVRGVDAIAISRKMMGATFGPNAEPGTIRGDFGASKSFNLIHGSDSTEAAQREIELFFEQGEVQEWSPAGLDWIYDRAEELKS
jgi:nucleoside-diphosphate kinase